MAAAEQIPAALREIGRLRELTFRRAGEGTDEAADLDSFDRHYEHLLVWNREKRQIVGAYRPARTDEILVSMGARGLYINAKDDSKGCELALDKARGLSIHMSCASQSWRDLAIIKLLSQ